MLPTTNDTTKRVKSLLDLTNTNNLGNVSNSTQTNDVQNTQDGFNSYENTFLSNEFHDMYNKSNHDDTKDHFVSEYSWMYPFESELSSNEDTTYKTLQLTTKEVTIYICLYRICKGANDYPYLQYKLKASLKSRTKQNKTQQMVFPSISYKLTSESKDVLSFMKRADEYVLNTMHCDRFEYKGMYYLDYDREEDVQDVEMSKSVYSGMGGEKKENNEDDDYSSDSSYELDSEFHSYNTNTGEGERSSSCLYLFYYDMSQENIGGSQLIPVNVTSKTEWWWVCIHEMFNTKRVLNYRIGSSVTSFFIHQPLALFLVNKEGVLYETPHVLYKGLPSEMSLTEMCKFGPRIQVDDNNISLERRKYLIKKNINEILIHGSYYYFYNYFDSIRGACYTYDYDTNTYRKNESDDCYLFRYVVFLGRLKVLNFDKMKGVTNHVSISNAYMSRDHNWPLSGYDSIYHGKYTLTNTNEKPNNLYPAFSVCDPNNFLGITYHKIDMASVSSDIKDMFKRKKYLKLK